MPKDAQFKDYFVPKTIEEALNLSNTGKGKIIGGGTTFFELAQRGLFSDVEYIIDLRELGMDYFTEDAKVFRIGATATMSKLLTNERLSYSDLAGISDALKCVEPLQVRNVATIGGTICASIPFFDMPVALCALNSSALIKSVNSEREVPVSELFIDNLVSGLATDEILFEVRVPKKESFRSASSFVKHSRSGFDIGIATCGMDVSINSTMKIKQSRVFIGNVSGVPFRATMVEEVLLDKDLLDPIIIQEIDRSLEGIEPLSTLQGSSNYKKHVCKVLTKKAFDMCKGRLVSQKQVMA